MKKTIMAIAFGLSLFASSVQAELISFNFSGKWGNVDLRLDNWFTAGEEFQGTITYDSNSAPLPSKDIEKFRSVYTGLSMTFSSPMKWEALVINPEITIYNYPLGNFNDQFVIHFSEASGSRVLFTPLQEFKSDPGFVPLQSFLRGDFSLTDHQNTVFMDTSLPTLGTVNPLMPFEFGIFYLSFFDISSSIDPNNRRMIASGITHPAPEPASIMLLATGMIGLSVFRKKRDH